MDLIGLQSSLDSILRWVAGVFWLLVSCAGLRKYMRMQFRSAAVTQFRLPTIDLFWPRTNQFTCADHRPRSGITYSFITRQKCSSSAQQWANFKSSIHFDPFVPRHHRRRATIQVSGSNSLFWSDCVCLFVCCLFWASQNNLINDSARLAADYNLIFRFVFILDAHVAVRITAMGSIVSLDFQGLPITIWNLWESVNEWSWRRSACVISDSLLEVISGWAGY